MELDISKHRKKSDQPEMLPYEAFKQIQESMQAKNMQELEDAKNSGDLNAQAEYCRESKLSKD